MHGSSRGPWTRRPCDEAGWVACSWTSLLWGAWCEADDSTDARGDPALLGGRRGRRRGRERRRARRCWPVQCVAREPSAGRERKAEALVELGPHAQMGACRREVARPLVAHARAERPGLEAERGQRSEQERVLLEAVAAAAVTDQLALDRGRIDVDAAAEQHVEVLERD